MSGDMENIVMPWSREAEQSLLGSLILDPRAMDQVGQMTEGDFYQEAHGLIFGAVRSLLAAHQPVDVVTVFEALNERGQAEACGGLSYLNALAQSVPSAKNAKRYAQTVRDKAAGRSLVVVLDEALTIAREAAPLEERMDRIAALMSGLQRTRVQKEPRHIAEIAAARTLYYEDLAEGNVTPGWPTHIPSLDQALVGGVRPGKVYVLAARPSVGKSSLSQQIGTTLARDGHPVLFLSQEMDGDELADRAVSHVGRIDYSGLLSGQMDQEDWNRATEALDSLAKTPFWVEDQGALTLADIKAKARCIKGLRVLILDYVQLCAASVTTAKSNRNAQVEEISRGLKALSKEMGLAVIVLSQLNRDVENRPNKRPQLSDLRDSGAVEQDADTVIFLWPVRQDGERRLTGCGIDKNRGGKCMEFGLDFYGAQQRWVESTESIAPQQQQSKKGGQWE